MVKVDKPCTLNCLLDHLLSALSILSLGRASDLWAAPLGPGTDLTPQPMPSGEHGCQLKSYVASCTLASWPAVFKSTNQLHLFLNFFFRTCNYSMHVIRDLENTEEWKDRKQNSPKIPPFEDDQCYHWSLIFLPLIINSFILFFLSLHNLNHTLCIADWLAFFFF